MSIVMCVVSVAVKVSTSLSGSLKYLLKSRLCTMSSCQTCGGIPWVTCGCGDNAIAIATMSAMPTNIHVTLCDTGIGCFLTRANMLCVPYLDISAVKNIASLLSPVFLSGIVFQVWFE